MLTCARHYSQHFPCINSCNPHKEEGTIIILILHIRKLRQEEVKPLVLGCMTHKWQSQDLNPGSRVQSPGRLNHYAVLPLSERLSFPSFPYKSLCVPCAWLTSSKSLWSLAHILPVPLLWVLSYGTCWHVKWHFLLFSNFKVFHGSLQYSRIQKRVILFTLPFSLMTS